MRKFFNLQGFFYFTLFALMKKSLDYQVIPSHYDLFVDVNEKEFSGTVTMHLHAKDPVSSFKFNSKNLVLSELSVFKKEENNESIFNNYTEEDEFVTVQLLESIVGDFFLRVSYKGHYTDNMEGFYKSDYNGKSIYSTHFEPTDARSAFPCFDQPDMKSTFSISINVPEGNIALSNNELESVKDTLYIFKKTPKMSTYIVAWVVGKLSYNEDKTASPHIRVYADESEMEWTDFSLKVARLCLKFFEQYFEMDYPLPKLDMVAIPSFAMGAMENWGLITFRQTSLLFDKNSTPMRFKKNIAITVCHELAHMWFGNLVTMKWWNDLWLNEGFATWAATLAVSESLQDILSWDAWSSFIIDEIQSGMRMDSLKSTHPIAVTVENPTEIGQIFDAISYSKGSTIIKMLEDWLGPEVFRLGLVDYIKKYSYENAEKQDLWDCLTDRANKSNKSLKINVSDVIDPWVVREGFPYVQVEENNDTIRLTQKRFTLGFEQDDEPWPIPMSISWGNKSEKTSFIMTEKTLEIPKKSDNFEFVDHLFGFYRILYPSERLMKFFNSSVSSNEKIKFYNDQHAFVKALLAEPSTVIRMVDYLKDEDNYEALASGVSGLQSLRSIFYFDKEKLDFFNSKILSILSDKAAAIDITERKIGINEVSASSLIISAAFGAGDKNVLERFKNVKIGEFNNEYIRVYLSALTKTDEGFDEVFKFHTENFKPGQKQQALVALGSTDIETRIDYIFDNISFAKPHDSIYLFLGFSSNLDHRNKIAELFMNNFGFISDYINNKSLLRHAIKYALINVIQDGHVEKVKTFLKNLSDDKELKSAVDQTLDSLDIGIKIKEKYMNSKFE